MPTPPGTGRYPRRNRGKPGSRQGKDRARRVVTIGVSYWHTPFYSDPVLAMTDAAIVGVSDPDPARAAGLAERAKCPVFDDYSEMCGLHRVRDGRPPIADLSDNAAAVALIEAAYAMSPLPV